MVNYQTWVNPKESNRSGCLSHLSNARRQNTYYIPLLVNSLILCATNAKSLSLFVKLIRLGLGISYLKDPVTLHTYLMWVSVETQSLSLFLCLSLCTCMQNDESVHMVLVSERVGNRWCSTLRGEVTDANRQANAAQHNYRHPLSIPPAEI